MWFQRDELKFIKNESYLAQKLFKMENLNANSWKIGRVVVNVVGQPKVTEVQKLFINTHFLLH